MPVGAPPFCCPAASALLGPVHTTGAVAPGANFSEFKE